MTLEQFLEAGKAKLPEGTKLEVAHYIGDAIASPWVAFIGTDRDLACGYTPEEALASISMWRDKSGDRKAQRIAALKAELAELEQ